MTSTTTSAKMSAPKSKSAPKSFFYLFKLPVEGHPECLGVLNPKTLTKKLTEELECEFLATFPKKDFIIHPGFREDKRWDLASKLLAITDTVYVNDNGANECNVNTATIVTNMQHREAMGGCPHLFGHVLLVVKEEDMKKAEIDHLSLVIVEVFEPEDDAEEEAKKKECAEKGYEYNEDFGEIFLRPCA